MLFKFILLSLFVSYALGGDCSWDGAKMDSSNLGEQIPKDLLCNSFSLKTPNVDIWEADNSNFGYPYVRVAGSGCNIGSTTNDLGGFIWDNSSPFGDDTIKNYIYTDTVNSYCLIEFSSSAAKVSYKINAASGTHANVTFIDAGKKSINCDYALNHAGTNTYRSMYANIISNGPVPQYLNVTGRFALGDLRFVIYGGSTDGPTTYITPVDPPVAPVAAAPVVQTKTSDAVATAAIGLLSVITLLML